MSTALHNLSDYDPNQLPEKEMLRKQGYVIVVADWNSDITYPLMEGAYQTLVAAGVPEDNILIQHVPGTVELTYAAAKYIEKYGQTGEKSGADYQHHSVINPFGHGQQRPYLAAIIAIGCVIKGDTPHFDYVCQSATSGITQLNIQGKVPVVFSVLTTLNKEQAQDRAGGKLGNKGIEGAYTAMRMANLIGVDCHSVIE